MCRYDIVLIENDKDKMIKLQKGHGGWKSSMTSVGISLVSSLLLSTLIPSKMNIFTHILK